MFRGPWPDRDAVVTMSSHDRIALLYQSIPSPLLEGMRKPMKPGGYSDSGADIAYSLRQAGVSVVTPVAQPDPARDLDWVFPDSQDGLREALAAGATVLWANTILFSGHPLESLSDSGIRVIGQQPAAVHAFDDKWQTNCGLAEQGLPVAPAFTLSLDEIEAVSLASIAAYGFEPPCVVKPIRGRGSEGVVKVSSLDALKAAVAALLSATVVVEGESWPKYGRRCMVEPYLPGQEITITVMPPGRYQIAGREHRMDACWSLPAVARFHHQDGIAPYNGVVAVTQNSRVLSPAEQVDPLIQEVLAQCAQAGDWVGARAPIRIDCRADSQGRYILFDLNMKPNMTGAGRVGRDDQDSLTALAARAIGWSYSELLLAMAAQAWPVSGGFSWAPPTPAKGRSAL